MGKLTLKGEWIEVKDKLRQTVDVPVWACVTVIALGALLFLARKKK